MLEVLQDLGINLSPEPIIAVAEAVTLFRQRKKLGPMLEKVRSFWSLREDIAQINYMHQQGSFSYPPLSSFVADLYKHPRM